MIELDDLLYVLAKPQRITAIIAGELNQVKDQVGDARRSEIQVYAQDLNLEDLITPAGVCRRIEYYVADNPVAATEAYPRETGASVAARSRVPGSEIGR